MPRKLALTLFGMSLLIFTSSCALVPNKLLSGKVKSKGSFKFSKKKKKVSKKTFHSSNMFGKKERSGSSFNVKVKHSGSSSRFSKRGKKNKSKKGLRKFFLINKRERFNNSFNSTPKSFGSSYGFNSKSKRVKIKKILFFFVPRERYKDSFRGAKIDRSFKHNKYSKKDKRVKHRRPVFNKRYEKPPKKKKLNLELVPDEMKW